MCPLFASSLKKKKERKERKEKNCISLDSAARRTVQRNTALAAGRPNHLGPNCVLGGSSHFENFMDGLPETVKVVVY